MEKGYCNSIHNEHLQEGHKAIITSFELPGEFNEKEFKKTATNINWFKAGKSKRTNLAREYHNALEGSAFAISPCNESDKYSKKFINCIGTTLIGHSKKRNKDVSILIHVRPDLIIGPEQQLFTQAFLESMREFKNETLEGSRDIVIFGGNYLPKKISKRSTYATNYASAVSNMSHMIKNQFKFIPTILGPKLTRQGATDAFLKTQQRHLHLVQPEQPNNITNVAYQLNKTPYCDGLEELRKKWDETLIQLAI